MKKRLYYFTSEEHAMNNIFKKRMKISLLNYLNDPFELLSINNSDPNLYDFINKHKTGLSYTHGLICFSESCKSPLMWGHYADNHKGICLGFDVDTKSPEYKEFVKVIYKKEKVHFKIEQLEEGFNKKLIKFKDISWEYEREWRALVTLKGKDQLSHDLYFKQFTSSLKLKEVIYGIRGHVNKDLLMHAVRPNIWDELKKDYIEVFKSSMSRDYFRIEKSKQFDLLH